MNAAVEKIRRAMPVKYVSRFALVSAAELQATEFPPLRFFVEGLVCEGLCLVVGAPKIGKSWLLLQLASGIALGKGVFGLKTEKTGVLYFALEDSPRRLRKRLEQLGSKWPDGLKFATDLPADCGKDGFIGCLRTELEENPGTGMVVIDTLQHVRAGGKSGNLYELDSDFLKPFHKLAKTLGISIVLVHHTRKAESSDPFERISGSQGLMGVADTVIMVEAARGKADRILRITGRDVEERELAMKFEGGAWTCLGDAADIQMSEKRRKVVEAVRNAGKPIGPKEISKASGVALGSVKNMMSALVSGGWVGKETRGKYACPAGNGGARGSTPVKVGDLKTSRGNSL